MDGAADCDVLVVGGGPAGLAGAIALRLRGADVVLADGLRPPIDKACGEGLMPDARRELMELGVDLAGRGTEFQGILFASERAQVAAKFPRGSGMGVRRTALHEALLVRAEEVGVRMRWGCPVMLGAGRAVEVDGARCSYRWLVGADGQTSRVRGWAGLEAARVRSRRFGFRAHFRVTPWSRYVEIHWGALGQAYVTPVGPEELGVAVVTRNPETRLDEVLAEIPALRAKLEGAERTTTERGALTLTRRLRRVTRGEVALLGDASGAVDAVTGEGLAAAFRQALLLAESLAAGGLDLYEARHAATLALAQRMAGLMLMLDRFPRLQRRALGVLAARPELFAGMLAVHVGEQPMPQFVLRHGAELGALLLAPVLA